MTHSSSPPPHLVAAFLRDIKDGHLPNPQSFSSSSPQVTPSSPDHASLSPEAFWTCSNVHGDTPLLVAARHGHVTVLDALCRRCGVSLEHRNSDGKTALHEASQSGQEECVQYLLNQGAKVDALKRADWDSTSVVRTLVSAGASLNLHNKDGWTPFHLACRQGNREIVMFLLETAPQCWDTVSNNGRTPLHTAALHGRLEAIQILRHHCFYSTDSTDSCGVTPLMDAARGNHVTVLEYLLDEYSADIAASDVLGRCALHHAAQGGAGEAIECLVTRGAEVNQAVSINAITPLHYAAKEGQATAVAVLLKHSADATLTDKRGRTALDMALCARGGEEAVDILQHTAT